MNAYTPFFILLICWFLGSIPSLAQEPSVTGIIMGGTEILPGATVFLEETEEGTITNAKGQFLFTDLRAGNYTILINFIGFEEKRISLQVAAKETIDLGTIQLETSTTDLNEVQVQEKMEEGGEMTARLKMLRSDRISNVVGEESIARLPDKNAGEALSRLAGVVLETDQGEGKYVSFRGTPVDWSSTLVNGDRMPIANEEMEGRSLNFDVLPTSLVAYIENTISLTPYFEGDAIAGTANLITKDTPDSLLLEFQSGIGYNVKAAKPIWNGALSLGNRVFNDKLGILLGGSIFSRNWSTDNYEIFYGNNNDHSLQRLELRHYDGLKTSYGANFKLDYRFSKEHTIYTSGFLGITNDDEFNRLTQFNWVAGVGQSVRVQNIHNILSNQLTGVEVGGRHQFSKLQVDWKVAQYENVFRYGDVPFEADNPSNGYFVVEFEKVVRYNDYLNLDENGEVTDPINAFTRLKLLDIDSPVPDYGDPYDGIIPSYDNIVAVKPSDTLFVFNKAFSELNRHEEKDPLVARLDFNYEYSEKIDLRAGLKYRTKEGSRRLGLDGWVRNPLDPGVIVIDEFNPELYIDESDFLSEIGSPYVGITYPFLADEQIDNFVPSMRDRIVYLPFGTETPFYKEYVGSSFVYQEDVIAGYAMGNVRLSPRLHLTGGIRVEDTHVQIAADSVIDNVATNSREIIQVKLDRRFLAVLPMVNLRYQLKERSLLRLSLTRSFRRPNFNEMKPGEPEIHYSHFHVLYGNPRIEPTFSWNSDLSIQHFFGLKGMVMLSLYYKRVTNHIFASFEAQNLDIAGESNQFLVPGGLASKRYQNAPYANLAGVEFTVSRKLDFIAPALRNFELMFNYTYTYSRMRIEAREELQPLPRQAPSLFNFRLSYDSPKLNVNLGLNYRDPYLEELNLFALKDPTTGEVTVIQQDSEFDIYMGVNLSMDAAMALHLNPRLSLTLEINNLLNTPFIVYRGRRERPIQTEWYGQRGQVGIQYNLN